MAETDPALAGGDLLPARRVRVRVFCHVGPDDRDILPAFLDHYRKLGAGAFHLIAHGDDAAAACRLQAGTSDDVAIAVAAAGPADGADRRAMSHAAIRAHIGDWALLADADEFVELPYRDLPTTIRALTAFGLAGLPAFALDRLASDGRPPPLEPGDDPQAVFPNCSTAAAGPIAVPLFPVRDNHVPPDDGATLDTPLRAVMHRFRRRRTPPGGGTFPYTRQTLFDRGLLQRPGRKQIGGLVMLARRARTVRGEAAGNDTERLARFTRRLQESWDRPSAVPDLLRPRASGLLGKRGHIAYVTFEFAGPTKGGGIGTAVAAEVARLAADGHRLSVLYCPLLADPGDPSRAGDWQARDIRFDLSHHRLDPAFGLGDQLSALGYEIVQWLRDRDPDIVHFHDFLGLGAMAAAAQKQGLMPAGTRIIVAAHGCTPWLLQGNGKPMTIDRMRIVHAEREQFRHADHVTAPSAFMLDWLRRLGEPLPARVHVRRNLAVAEVRGLTRPKPQGWRPDEFVFFGRIEIHKGIDVFCRAMTRLVEQGRRDFRVTLLGRADNEERTRRLIAAAADACSMPFRQIHDLDTAAALDYLRAADAVAVMPSRTDNLPYTVLECIDNAVPFFAAPVGGVPEMIAPEDRDRVLRAGSADDLVAALSHALDHGHAPAGPAYDQDDAALRWLAWHGEMLEEGVDRPAAAEMPAPDLCLYGAGSDAQIGLGDGAAANRLAAVGDRPYLLFVHGSVQTDPELASSFLRAAVTCEADAVVSSFRLHIRTADGGPEAAPILIHATAGPFSLLPFRNTYGAPVFLIKRDAFDRLGGFSEDDHLHGVEHWDLLNRLVLAGGQVAAVPLPLATMTVDARGAATGALPEWVAARLTAPFLEQASLPWRDAFHLLSDMIAAVPYPQSATAPAADTDAMDLPRLRARLKDAGQEFDGLMLSRGALLRQFIMLNIERSPLRWLSRRRSRRRTRN